MVRSGGTLTIFDKCGLKLSSKGRTREAAKNRGTLLQGVRFFGDGVRAHCLVMTTRPRQVRFIDAIHVEDDADAVVRF